MMKIPDPSLLSRPATDAGTRSFRRHFFGTTVHLKLAKAFLDTMTTDDDGARTP